MTHANRHINFILLFVAAFFISTGLVKAYDTTFDVTGTSTGITNFEYSAYYNCQGNDYCQSDSVILRTNHYNNFNVVTYVTDLAGQYFYGAGSHIWTDMVTPNVTNPFNGTIINMCATSPKFTVNFRTFGSQTVGSIIDYSGVVVQTDQSCLNYVDGHAVDSYVYQLAVDSVSWELDELGDMPYNRYKIEIMPYAEVAIRFIGFADLIGPTGKPTDIAKRYWRELDEAQWREDNLAELRDLQQAQATSQSENRTFFDNVRIWFTNLFSSISSLGDRISGFFSGIGDRIGGFFSTLWTNISNKLNSFLDFTTQPLEDLFDEFSYRINEEGLQTVVTAPLDVLDNLIDYQKSTNYTISFKIYGKTVTLPDGDTIWNKLSQSGNANNSLGLTFYAFWNIFLGGLIMYRMLLYAYNTIHNAFQFDNDKVEVIKL